MAKASKAKKQTPYKLETMGDDDRQALVKKLRTFIRKEGGAYLDDPNITSIGIGLKIRGDGADQELTDEICIQFTVGEKLINLDTITSTEKIETEEIPSTLIIDGVVIATDIVERTYRPTYTIMAPEAIEENRRKVRMNPVQPGVSVGHNGFSAGTLGLIVYDKSNGKPCILSNWHVLQGNAGTIGDVIVQPGKHDDNSTQRNSVGTLSRSYLGLAGDMAIASIEGRSFEPKIMDLDITPDQIARVDLMDGLVKSGRTTGTTHGLVRRIDVTVKVDYQGAMGERRIGGFEIGPNPKFPSERFEISMGGDSGSVWLITDADGKPTNAIAGLHFAGEGKGNPDEHALACYAHSVAKKMNISLTPTSVAKENLRMGYDPFFCGHPLPVPELTGEQMEDAVHLDGSHLIPYTHFSVCQSKARKIARYVAWNIDGGSLKTITRKGMGFRVDRRINKAYRAGNELYRNNPLDKGHIARRVDLNWGPLEEAKRANKDSFYYTNIAPQHERFNRSSLKGLWGKLENRVYEEVDVKNFKVSVLAGPVFGAEDTPHRGVLIPRAFWKIIAYRDNEDGEFKAQAFVLTQKDLVSGIESLDLDEYAVYAVSIDHLSELTDMEFPNLTDGKDGGIRMESFDDGIEARKINAYDPVFA